MVYLRERGGKPDFRKRESAGCRLPVRVSQHARTHARLRECDKLCEEAGYDIEESHHKRTCYVPDINARRARTKSATLRAASKGKEEAGNLLSP